MERVVFIINPKAGIKSNRGVERLIVRKSSQKRINYSIEYTKKKGDGFYLAVKYINSGFDRIISVGGDGTLREIIEAAAFKNVVVGILPCGSGNGAARNLGIPLDLHEAMDVALGDKIAEIDCGVCNARLFINVCGVGFDAYIAKLFNKNRIRGLIPYFLYGIRSYFTYKPIDVEVEFDGNRRFFRPFVLSVANGREYGGGAIINPLSSISDARIEMIVVEMDSKFYYLRRIHTLFNGRILENRNVYCFTSTNFMLKLPRGSVYHLDGEDFICDDGILRVSVMHKAVRFALKDEIL